MNKRTAALIGVAAVLLIFAGAFCGAAAAIDTSGLPTSGDIPAGTYKLTDNMQLTGELTVPSGKTVTIDLNGYAIHIWSRITVKGTLSLQDNSPKQTGELISGIVVVESNGTFNMSGGSRTGCYNQWCVFIKDDGTFNMSGGTISGNNTASYGGGVYVSEGTFNMSGGTISGNSAARGGGVCNYGTFIMTGGSIIRNIAEEEGGGVENKGTFEMSGGSITDNSAKKYTGGGVWNSGTFTMSGGSITGNSAKMYYGGVDSIGTFNVSGTPVIKKNTEIDGSASNVHVHSSKVITVTGALRSGAEIWIVDMGIGYPFAQGTSSYTVTADDARYFYPDNGFANQIIVGSNSLTWGIKSASSPAPIIGIFAGLGAVAAVLAARRK